MTPPQIPPHKPKRSKDTVFPPPPSSEEDEFENSSSQTLELKLSKIQAMLEKRERREDTGVHRINTQQLQSSLEANIEAKITAYEAAVGAVLRRIAFRWSLAILTTLGIGGGGAVLYIRKGSTEEAVEVKETVDEKSNVLEDRIGDTEKRIDNVEKMKHELVDIRDAIDSLAEQMEKLAAPPRERTRRPRTAPAPDHE